MIAAASNAGSAPDTRNAPRAAIKVSGLENISGLANTSGVLAEAGADAVWRGARSSRSWVTVEPFWESCVSLDATPQR
jgi:hypothetical protein